jgi:hypothetical protein
MSSISSALNATKRTSCTGRPGERGKGIRTIQRSAGARRGRPRGSAVRCRRRRLMQRDVSTLLLVCAVCGCASTSALDLSTPENAYKATIDAFRRGDPGQLKMCLSARLVAEMQRSPEAYVKNWQECIESLGGYNRPVIGTTYLKDEVRGGATVQCAHVRLSPVKGAQDFSRMICEDGKWKFDER